MKQKKKLDNTISAAVGLGKSSCLGNLAHFKSLVLISPKSPAKFL